jgi:two-component system chemotaxis response regulator CheY
LFVKVMLVDDSATMRTIERRCLKQLGVTDISEGEDGLQALQQFDGSEFDLVITDWNMPRMDGLTLLREIRQRNTRVPVVMVTNETENKRFREAVAAGASDYLCKPFTSVQLREKFEKWAVLPTTPSAAP